MHAIIIMFEKISINVATWSWPNLSQIIIITLYANKQIIK